MKDMKVYFWVSILHALHGKTKRGAFYAKAPLNNIS